MIFVYIMNTVVIIICIFRMFILLIIFEIGLFVDILISFRFIFVFIVFIVIFIFYLHYCYCSLCSIYSSHILILKTGNVLFDFHMFLSCFNIILILIMIILFFYSFV